jgi:hypothetical protein
MKMENKPAEKAALPIITFEHDVTVHSLTGHLEKQGEGRTATRVPREGSLILRLLISDR